MLYYTIDYTILYYTITMLYCTITITILYYYYYYTTDGLSLPHLTGRKDQTLSNYSINN